MNSREADRLYQAIIGYSNQYVEGRGRRFDAAAQQRIRELGFTAVLRLHTEGIAVTDVRISEIQRALDRILSGPVAEARIANRMDLGSIQIEASLRSICPVWPFC
jgi:hypothetical protein